MNILILGHRGQIGSPLTTYLTNKGHTVTGWDKKNGIHEDLSLFENWYRLVKDISNSDKIIFLAFEVGGSKYLKNVDGKFAYIDENVAIMHNVFAALKITNKPFLFSSSQMANMHHTNYGFLKDLGERYTRSLSNGWICRFWNIYGYEDPLDPKSHVITDFLKGAKQGKIEMLTDGLEERQFLHVDDCVTAIEGWVDDYWDDKSKYYDITSFQWDLVTQVALITKYLEKHNVNIVVGDKKDNLQKGIKNEPDRYILKFWKPTISLQEGIKKVKQCIEK